MLVETHHEMGVQFRLSLICAQGRCPVLHCWGGSLLSQVSIVWAGLIIGVGEKLFESCIVCAFPGGACTWNWLCLYMLALIFSIRRLFVTKACSGRRRSN